MDDKKPLNDVEKLAKEMEQKAWQDCCDEMAEQGKLVFFLKHCRREDFELGFMMGAKAFGRIGFEQQTGNKVTVHIPKDLLPNKGEE